MKLIQKQDAREIANSKTCVAYEYPLGDKDINGAVIVLSGRYPEKGRTVNQKCKELAYVIEGSGMVVIENKQLHVQMGDLVFIEANERYYWEGNMKLFIPCTPAWYPEQHKEVE